MLISASSAQARIDIDVLFVYHTPKRNSGDALSQPKFGMEVESLFFLIVMYIQIKCLLRVLRLLNEQGKMWGGT